MGGSDEDGPQEDGPQGREEPQAVSELIDQFANQEVTLKRKTGEQEGWLTAEYAEPETILAVYSPSTRLQGFTGGEQRDFQGIVQTATQISVGDLINDHEIQAVYEQYDLNGELMFYEGSLS